MTEHWPTQDVHSNLRDCAPVFIVKLCTGPYYETGHHNYTLFIKC